MKRLTNATTRLWQSLPSIFDEEERRLVFQSVIIGVVVWAIVFALRTAVNWAFHTTLGYMEMLGNGPALVFILLPLLLGALLVSLIVKYRSTQIHYRDDNGDIHELTDVEGDGLERAISLYYTSEPAFEQLLQGQEGLDARWQLPTFSLSVRKWVATLITLGSGASGGLEASVTLIGESVAAGLFKPHRSVTAVRQSHTLFDRIVSWWQAGDTDDLQTAQLSGIAAAVAVVLGAPFAAAFFATEVMYRQRPILEKLLYSLISALVAYFLTNLATGGHSTFFEFEQTYVPPTTLRYTAVLVLMSGIISLVSLVFGKLRAYGESAFHRKIPVAWQRHLVGATITGLIAIFVATLTYQLGITEQGLELVLGSGEGVINAAFAGEVTLAIAMIALLAKIPATIATVGSGGSAGLLVPSIFFGTMVAAGLADIFGYEPMLLIVPGITASLVSIVNVPLAAILFTIEVFGSVYMIPALLVLVVTSILAHDRTIYRTQREKVNKRQILPGVSSRRVTVPPTWWGKTLIELNFRQQFDLNVVGLVEHRDASGVPRVRLDLSPTIPLEEGDVLVVLGRDEQLQLLEDFVQEQRAAAWDTDEL